MRNLHLIRTRWPARLALFALISCGVALAEPPPRIALTGATVIPISGEKIAGATILVDRGKIVAVGTDVKVPYDYIVYELDGKYVMPGLVVAHTSGGLDRANESLPVTPFLDVYDALDPSQLFFEEALRDGETALHVIPGNDCVIGGQGRVVKPIGLSPDEMTIRPSGFLKFSISPKRGYDRMRQMATMRETFRELDDYLEKLAEQEYEKKLKKEDKNIDVPPAEARERGKELVDPEDYDDLHGPLVALREGRLGAFVYCENAMDVAPAVQLAKDEGFLDRTVLVIGPECYKAVAELKLANRPVVLSGDMVYREEDLYTGEIKETFVPKVIADAGLKFALLPGPASALAERYLTYQAARCVRNGVPVETALKAITIHPAEMLNLGDQLGSIEADKTANLVVFSGPPLEFNSWVDKVFVDGILAYDRDKDVRLQELFQTGEGDEEQEPAGGTEAEAPSTTTAPDVEGGTSNEEPN